MSCPCKFEAKIQASCAIDLARLVSSGKLVDQKAEALEHVGCITGSLGAYLKGDDAPMTFSAAAPSPDSCPDTLAACATEVERQLGGEGAQVSEVEVSQLSPLAVLAIRKLVKLVLDQLL